MLRREHAPIEATNADASGPNSLDCAAQRISHVPDMLNPLARFALLSRAPGLTPLPAHEPPESTRLVPTFVGFGTVGHPRPINRAAFAACRHWRLSPLLDGGGMHSVYSTQIGLCNVSPPTRTPLSASRETGRSAVWRCAAGRPASLRAQRRPSGWRSRTLPMARSRRGRFSSMKPSMSAQASSKHMELAGNRPTE
jgi:hypothetical protein